MDLFNNFLSVFINSLLAGDASLLSPSLQWSLYGLEVICTRTSSLKSKLRTNPFKSDSACGVVYKVTCPCCKKYFGESGRTIEETIKEHQADVNNQKSVEKITGLSQHLRESRHTPNWKEEEI